VTNDETASLFEELADVMEIAGENHFKVRSYRRAAESVRSLNSNLAGMKPEEITSIPGVGKAIFEKIRSAIETGTFPTLEKWRATGYAGLRPLLVVPGVTGRKLSNLVKRLNIDSLDGIKEMIDKGEFQRQDSIDREAKNGILEYLSRKR
jgi:DNA polymerase (family 10)